MFEKMGFENIGKRESTSRNTRSVLVAQGFVRILLTEPINSKGDYSDPALKFLREQGEGVCVLALDVDNAFSAFTETTKRGAKPNLSPTKYETKDGQVTRAEIFTPGLVRYAFIERHAKQGPTLFDDELVANRLESPTPLNITRIDHLTNNVGIGEMKKWVEWYKQIFNFTVTRHFDINTGRTGLISDVVQSEDGKIIVPINEGHEKQSQVQEFVDRMKGPGVQHLAFLTTDIVHTLKDLKSIGQKFLSVPHAYYEEVPTRVPGVQEDIKLLEDLGLLLDGDDSGYLLQIFSQEIVGPFFFEYIERKGNKGFGEGNFKALFQAIERDQVERGVLKS
jgi:4-hydroxyphenylpyruvate dioxygenase